MALGLMVLSSVIALPIALAAWMAGYATFGQAAIAYMGLGWATMALACLAGLPMQTPRPQRVEHRPPRSVVVDVNFANRH